MRGTDAAGCCDSRLPTAYSPIAADSPAAAASQGLAVTRPDTESHIVRLNQTESDRVRHSQTNSDTIRHMHIMFDLGVTMSDSV